LGLFISKSIIESHGGKIWAENNKDGRGATLSFSLPLKD
jgi:signal transduction histidine kinase